MFQIMVALAWFLLLSVSYLYANIDELSREADVIATIDGSSVQPVAGVTIADLSPSSITKITTTTNST